MAKLKEKAFWITIGDVVGRGLSFATSIYLARTLGAEFYGLITVAISILGYATWVSDLGLNHIGAREAAKIPSKRIFHLIEIFRTKLFLGLMVLILSAIIISFMDMDTTKKQVILGYLFSIIPYMALLEWFYSGKQEFGKIALSKTVNGLMYFLLVFIFIRSVDDVALVPILYTAGVSVAALTLGTFAIRDKPFTLPSRNIQLYQDLLKSASILGLGQFFAQIVTLLPPILLGIFLTLEDAGMYGAAFRIVILAMMIDRVFVSLLLPNLASLWTINPESARQAVNIVLKLVVAGGALIAMITAISAEQIIATLFGDEYLGSVIFLQVLSVMIAATFMNSLFSFGLIATNKDKKYFMATSLGGTLSIVLMVFFAFLGNPLYVALSVSLAEVIITAFTFHWFRKTISFDYLKPLLVSYSTAILLFFLFILSPLMPVLNAAIAAVIFVIVILATGTLTQDHIAWTRKKILE